jgi:hypothetical protein
MDRLKLSWKMALRVHSQQQKMAPQMTFIGLGQMGMVCLVIWIPPLTTQVTKKQSLRQYRRIFSLAVKSRSRLFFTTAPRRRLTNTVKDLAVARLQIQLLQQSRRQILSGYAFKTGMLSKRSSRRFFSLQSRESCLLTVLPSPPPRQTLSQSEFYVQEASLWHCLVHTQICL